MSKLTKESALREAAAVYEGAKSAAHAVGKSGEPSKSEYQASLRSLLLLELTDNNVGAAAIDEHNRWREVRAIIGDDEANALADSIGRFTGDNKEFLIRTIATGNEQEYKLIMSRYLQTIDWKTFAIKHPTMTGKVGENVIGGFEFLSKLLTPKKR